MMKAMLNLPNILTISRIFLIPVIIALFMAEPVMGAVAAWINLGLYIAAAVTDFLDGYLARKMNAKTAFGTFLDPISDKIFVACVLTALVAFGRLPDLWIVPVLVIFAREFLVSGLREFLGPHHVQLPVTRLAKWKTAVQMVATGFLIVGPYAPYTLEAGQWGLALAAVITAVTGWGYWKAGFSYMKTMP